MIIDIPIGKAVTPLEIKNENDSGCENCCLEYSESCHYFCCAETRKDGKNVVFKLVDYNFNPGEPLYWIKEGLEWVCPECGTHTITFSCCPHCGRRLRFPPPIPAGSVKNE